MSDFILSLDQGTTLSQAFIFDHAGSIVARAEKEITQHYPKPGYVEHDTEEIWSTQAGVAAEATTKAGINGTNIRAIGISNQRETVIVWNRDTGKPIHRAIVWLDRRTSDFCERLKSEGQADTIREKTGLIIDAYFSATKIKWILENVDGAAELAEKGKLAFGSVDSWIIWKFTRGRKHVTDVTNASRTMLYNIHSMDWDDELLELFGIPRSMMPEVKASSYEFGETATTIFASKIPICGVAGNQHAGLFGQMCIEPGMTKNNYGTGSFAMLNTGNDPVTSRNNLLTTIAWQIHGQRPVYALEGSIFAAGAAIKWLRDGLSLIRSVSEIEMLAQSENDNGGVYFVPAFDGLGAPHWDQNARGMIIGLTRATTTGHIAKAALESIAFQTVDVLQAMQFDSNIDVQELRVDGSITNLNTLMQFQADILKLPAIRPKILETPALGAAYLAGLKTGFWKDTDEIKSQWQESKRFEPAMDGSLVDSYKAGWKKALERSKSWAE